MAKRKKIFITGGHLTPALATIELLLKKDYEIWYIGRKYAQEEDASISVEYQTLLKYEGKVNKTAAAGRIKSLWQTAYASHAKYNVTNFSEFSRIEAIILYKLFYPNLL